MSEVLWHSRRRAAHLGRWAHRCIARGASMTRLSLKNQSLVFVLLCVLVTACSSNWQTIQPAVSPLATEIKMPTATSAPSAVPTPTSMPTSVPPTIVPPEAQTSGICKSTNYCPQTDCRKDECLFVSPSEPDHPVGIAVVRGYYAKVERTGFGETKFCDSFVIVDGSQVLISSYLSLIKAGNTVNSKNELNQPIISLDLSQVEAKDRQKILASSKDKTIEVLLLSPIPRGMGAPVCYSPVEIIKVN